MRSSIVLAGALPEEISLSLLLAQDDYILLHRLVLLFEVGTANLSQWM